MSQSIIASRSNLNYTELNDHTTQLADNAAILGDGAEMNQFRNLGDATIAGDDVVSGVKVGDNSSMIVQSMDDRTQSLLTQAMEISARNAENFMSLAAERDAPNPQQPLATAIEITAGTDRREQAWIGAAVIAVAVMVIFNMKRKK